MYIIEFDQKAINRVIEDIKVIISITKRLEDYQFEFNEKVVKPIETIRQKKIVYSDEIYSFKKRIGTQAMLKQIYFTEMQNRILWSRK